MPVRRPSWPLILGVRARWPRAGQGWTDTNCSNSKLTTGDRNYREAQISYNLTDDGTPGTTLNGAKMVYHDMGASGSSVVATYDLVNINFRDSIATVTGNTGDLGADADGDSATFTIKEGTIRPGQLRLTPWGRSFVAARLVHHPAAGA